MFETHINAGIKSIKVKADYSEGIVSRVCTMTLSREFESTVAAGLGADAKKALASLKGGAMLSCVLPIDRVHCEAQFSDEDGGIFIRRIVGTKATGKAGKDGGPPMIELEFQFDFDDGEAWNFLGRNAGATVGVTLNRLQLELVGTSAAAEA